MTGSPKNETKTTEPRIINPSILNVLIKIEDTGKSPATIETTGKALRKLSKNADINNTETVQQACKLIEQGFQHGLVMARNSNLQKTQVTTQQRLTNTPNLIYSPHQNEHP
jgi:hypothetical protein